jgi:hypothetical protein
MGETDSLYLQRDTRGKGTTHISGESMILYVPSYASVISPCARHIGTLFNFIRSKKLSWGLELASKHKFH